MKAFRDDLQNRQDDAEQDEETQVLLGLAAVAVLQHVVQPAPELEHLVAEKPRRRQLLLRRLGVQPSPT